MKSIDLIQKLRDIDPSGELEVVCGECDIWFLESLPAFYDGKLVTLIKDKAKEPFYNISGAKISTKGKKITLKLMGLGDVLIDNWSAKIDLSECPNGHIEVENMRREGYEFALKYDKYPCEACKYKPINFNNIDERCSDCQPHNEFNGYADA
jgi:hypothetical protein